MIIWVANEIAEKAKTDSIDVNGNNINSADERIINGESASNVAKSSNYYKKNLITAQKKIIKESAEAKTIAEAKE